MMVGGGACKIVPNNEIGFRSGNRYVRVEEQTRVTTSTRARKSDPLAPVDFALKLLGHCALRLCAHGVVFLSVLYCSPSSRD